MHRKWGEDGEAGSGFGKSPFLGSIFHVTTGLPHMAYIPPNADSFSTISPSVMQSTVMQPLELPDFPPVWRCLQHVPHLMCCLEPEPGASHRRKYRPSWS